MKTLIPNFKITLSFLTIVLLCGVPAMSYSGVCRVGDVLSPGESCTDPGTGDDFSVLGNGFGNYLFMTAGGGINLQGNINGKQRNFVAEKRADGNWEILSVTGGNVPASDPEPDTGDDAPDSDPEPEQTQPFRKLSVSVVSPLTEATLDGSTVELVLYDAAFEQDISKIREAVTVSGINGVTLDTTTLQRLNNRKVTVELKFDGTDLFTNASLLFNVAASAITNHKGNPLTAEIRVTANTDEALLKVYWIDAGDNKIQRANPDGSNIETLVTYGPDTRTIFVASTGVALDVLGGKMYWTNDDAHNIQRANLDGSNIETLVTHGQGARYLTDIALDVLGGKIYWTDNVSGKIQRANLDGSNIEDLSPRGQGLIWQPLAIALDVSGGKMYWTDPSNNKIQRANLDGSNVEDLVTHGLDLPAGIALDVLAGKMYWTDLGTEKIQRANLDGSNIEDIVTSEQPEWGGPLDIVLDLTAGKMYWIEYQDRIRRANLDGSNIETLVKDTDIWDIAIGIIPPVNQTLIAKEDVNRDGVVDVHDLAYVGLQYGQIGVNIADVNGDGVVNVDDLILVAAAVDAAAAAPAARAKVESHFTETQLQGWLTEARASGNTSRTYQRGIAVIEQFLTLFTPEKTALLANYPNPFNPETWIPYQLSEPTDVTLHIYAVNGAVVRTLDLGHQAAGTYQSRSRAAYWDGRNVVGEKVASGLYFYTLTAGDFTATRKMLIRK